MFVKFFKKIFGSRNDRLLKAYRAEVEKINALEPEYEKLEDLALQAKTDAFKQRLEQGESLDELLPEAFAAVREASKRVLGMRHYDVQMIGGIALHKGKIAEMRTGEGKTLVATLPAYLNALTGEGVHVITVNDYLAKRDAEWMGQVYEFLGLSTGVVLSGQTAQEKQLAYAMDITYGTNNEFGFDYLRDNMAIFKEEKVQRGQHYAIIDEVDSILIDEARTPLIISGPAEDRSVIYQKIDPLIQYLERGEEDLENKTTTGDYTVDEKNRQVYLTDQGYEKLEQKLKEIDILEPEESLFDAHNIGLLLNLNAALKAHVIFEKNRDYIVENGEVIIIDEHTGRKMIGRRWSEGLHQAVEAKEGVAIQPESQTFASITFQNLFRQYEKLAGMTGTADTEAGEFLATYKLEVVVIPPNKTPQRIDQPDLVFLDMEGKFAALVREIQETHEKGQPILIGTASIEMSELLSSLLTQAKIPHNVLNAKQHEREAHIIAAAGRPGAVTVATNMAGRGTDIVLGGNLEMELEALKNPTEQEIAAVKQDWEKRHQKVLELGGLKVIGSERHESRRIDNQLRGRSGRQGDPGETRFYLSLDDDLMRRFASERVKNMMRRLGMQSDEAIEHKMVTKSIERAQRQVERMHQDERANLLKFDDVANEQRKVVYAQRNELMESEDLSETLDNIRDSVFTDLFHQFIPAGSLPEQWLVPEFEVRLKEVFELNLPISQWLEEDKTLYEETLLQKLLETVKQIYLDKMSAIDTQTRHQFEREVLLRTIDEQWREHLAQMDYLRRGIHLRGFAQKDPFQEYRREAAEMFQNFLSEVMFETTKILLLVQIEAPQDVAAFEAELELERPKQLEAVHPAANAMAQAMSQEPMLSGEAEEPIAEQPSNTTYKRETPKVGRNAPCPCGSGKKYKHCCGKL